MDQCVILVGGKGTRLLPFTRKIPKAMIKIKGKPMMEILLLKNKDFGYKKFILCVQSVF